MNPRLVLTYCLFSLASAALSFAMTNADVLKMKEAGLSDETILAAIANQPAEYSTTPDDLITLKNAGVSETIIQQILARGNASRTAAPSPAATAQPAPSPAGGVTDFFAMDFPSIAPPMITPTVGHEYFTRYTLHHEGGEHSTTNYTRGLMLPINTRVRLLSMSGKVLTLRRSDTGEEIKVENVEKHSQRSLPEIARLLLAEESTRLDELPPELATAIRNGQMRKGMTKEQVLMTRGYPPGHETPSIESDRWVFWSSRFVKHTVLFSNGRLVEGRGLF
jgi:hypothetical protein